MGNCCCNLSEKPKTICLDCITRQKAQMMYLVCRDLRAFCSVSDCVISKFWPVLRTFRRRVLMKIKLKIYEVPVLHSGLKWTLIDIQQSACLNNKEMTMPFSEKINQFILLGREWFIHFACKSLHGMHRWNNMHCLR